MRRLVLLGLIFSWVPVVLAGDKVQPLNIKTGLWQVTKTMTITGVRHPLPPEALARMTPEQRAKFEALYSGAPKTWTSKNCVTKEKLNRDPFSEESERKSCTRTVLTSTGTKMEIREVCVERGVRSDRTLQMEAVDSENVKGSGHASGTADNKSGNIDVNFTAKWVGAVCTDTHQK